MNKDYFPKFLNDLRRHAAPGYHVVSGPIDAAVAMDWFAAQAIRCPSAFFDFLTTLGAGRFFDGDLVIFPPGLEKGTIGEATAGLPEADRAKFFVIGYDGTTEGCYCLDRSGDNPTVFWHNFRGRPDGRSAPQFF